MVSRRIFFKSLGVATTATVLGAPLMPLKAANSTFNTSIFSNKKRIALIGNSEQARLLMEFIDQHPGHLELVTPDHHTGHFSSARHLIQSESVADVVFISGIKQCEPEIMAAIEQGCEVCVDRLPVYEPKQLSKINAMASSYFSKIHIMYMIDGQPYLMPNKALEV